MALKIITAPTTEPLSVSDTITKLHLKVDDTAEDSLLTTYIPAARRACETETGRKLVTQTWTLYLDEFPCHEIDLQTAPVQSITSVKYIDTNGVQQTLDSSLYELDNVTLPAWLLPAYATVWPFTLRVANAVEITFVAGYGAASDVPEELKLWMLLQLGHWYENRSATSERPMLSLKFVDRLLDAHRIVRV